MSSQKFGFSWLQKERFEELVGGILMFDLELDQIVVLLTDRFVSSMRF